MFDIILAVTIVVVVVVVVVMGGVVVIIPIITGYIASPLNNSTGDCQQK
ncbi:hypothetical protein BFJ63_vAg18076 [Fusarium oxysporum f. sp. narcissi]|uniref:Uncharacterized protein n=1 Tax=Fusarium oxysporum f. sp. narcissi TaxID=451672 RepID=A0A4Q2V599_FUSOX|nr:hypothetical protein BFJ63_vAg18076 [Fusarium oxysporum f. sp. narcissi]